MNEESVVDPRICLLKQGFRAKVPRDHVTFPKSARAAKQLSAIVGAIHNTSVCKFAQMLKITSENSG